MIFGGLILEKLTILVNSCDKYEDAWEPFFKLFKIQWPDCPYEFVLNTETKQFNFDELSVRTVHPKDSNSVSWSKRCREALDQINSEYILFMLEDYFLLNPVNEVVFEKAVNILNNDSRVGAVILSRTLKENVKAADYTDIDFFKRKIDEEFVAWSLPILYRKSYLCKLLRDYESVWDFEKYAWYRAKMSRKSLLQQSDNSPSVFEYSSKIENGLGITQGKWLSGNIALFEKYGINNVDFENIGILSVEEALNANKINSNIKHHVAKKSNFIIEKLHTLKKIVVRAIVDFDKSAFYHYIKK